MTKGYTFDQRVRIGRFWLLCLVVALCPSIAIYFFASLSWTALGLFMPVFPSSTTCCVCNGCTDPGNGVAVTIVISSFTDDATCNGVGFGYTNCLCSNINGTYAGTTTTDVQSVIGNCMRSPVKNAPGIAVGCSHSIPGLCPVDQPLHFGIFNEDGSGNSLARANLSSVFGGTDNNNGRGEYNIPSSDKPINCGTPYGPKTMTVTAGTGFCGGQTPTITFQLG